MSDSKKTKKVSSKKINSHKSRIKGRSCPNSSYEPRYMELLTSHDTDKIISKLESLKRTKGK